MYGLSTRACEDVFTERSFQYSYSYGVKIAFKEPLAHFYHTEVNRKCEFMPVNDDVKILALLSEPLVQHNGASQVLVVGVNLLAQLVHKLVVEAGQI